MTDQETIDIIRQAFHDSMPPKPSEAKRLDLDAMECYEIFGDKHWTEVKSTEIMRSTFCFSFQPAETMFYYMPSYWTALMHETDEQNFIYVADVIVNYLAPDTWFYGHYIPTLSKDQAAALLRWMTWVGSQSNGIFFEEAQMCIGDLRVRFEL